MSIFNQPSAVVAPADANKANVEAAPTEGKVDGTESQVNNAPPARTYTGDDLSNIVKDRVAREKKSHAKETDALKKEIETLKAQLSGGKAVSPNVEEDFRSKVSQYEDEKKSLTGKLEKYRQQSLKSAVISKMAANNAVDVEDATELFLSKGIARLDDDDELVVDTVNGDLDEAVKEFLAKRAYLVRSSIQGGAGTKGPATPSVSTDRQKELEQKLGFTGKKKSIFGE